MGGDWRAVWFASPEVSITPISPECSLVCSRLYASASAQWTQEDVTTAELPFLTTAAAERIAAAAREAPPGYRGHDFYEPELVAARDLAMVAAAFSTAAPRGATLEQISIQDWQALPRAGGAGAPLTAQTPIDSIGGLVIPTLSPDKVNRVTRSLKCTALKILALPPGDPLDPVRALITYRGMLLQRGVVEGRLFRAGHAPYPDLTSRWIRQTVSRVGSAGIPGFTFRQARKVAVSVMRDRLGLELPDVMTFGGWHRESTVVSHYNRSVLTRAIAAQEDAGQGCVEHGV